MKRKILVVALGLLGVFAVAQAQLEETPVEEPGCSPATLPDVDQLIFAHIYAHVGLGEEPLVPFSHNMVSGVAKGKPGIADVSGWLIYDFNNAAPDERCPEGYLRFDIKSFEWGEIYEDNSMLRGLVDPGSFFCGIAEENIVELTGTITEGSGRFEGASGTWTLTGPPPFALKVYCSK